MPGASRRGATRSIGDQVGETTQPALGRLMLPLRLFLGLTFVYAGLVKLVDPAFLDPSAPGSLVEQLHLFARDSPLAPLITTIAIPLAVPIGLLIAIGEVAVGLGALLGLAGRLAAWGGFAISVLFFLTASWATSPYFYGPDLPYAAGWLTLALVGDGGLYVLRGRPFWGRLDRRADATTANWSPERRVFLEAGVLSVVTLLIAAVAGTRPALLRSLLGGASASGSTSDGSGPGTAAPSPPAIAGGSVAPSARPGAIATRVPGGPTIATVQAVNAAGSATFAIPSSGDPGVLIGLANGSIVAFDATCTHAGCPVEYVPQDRLLECPCHGAVFDPANGGSVLAGPTRQPLQALPITIDRKTGQIRLSG